MNTGPYLVAGGSCALLIRYQYVNGRIISVGDTADALASVALKTGESVEVPWRELRGERR